MTLINFSRLKHEPMIGYWSNEEVMKESINILKKGDVIGFQFGPVFGLGIDAQSAKARRKLEGIKKETKILSALMPAYQLHTLIKMSDIDSRLRAFVENPSTMMTMFGSLTFLGIPVDFKTAKKFNVPDSLLSKRKNTYFLHGLMPNGHSLMTKFVRQLHVCGIEYFGVTSMNEKGKKEITNEREAREFVKKEQLKILAIDDLYNMGEGSYPIIDFTNGKIIRAAGFIHQDILHALVKFKLDTSDMKPGHYNPIAHPLEILNPDTPSNKVRSAILNLLYKQTESKI